MLEEIIAAGFGGQGVMLIGQIACISAIQNGKKATWVPSYGPEMRGGTANCLCVISDEEIGSPLVEKPTTFFCMNQPSMDKFGKSVKEGGLVITNKLLVNSIQVGKNVDVVEVPVGDIAKEIGNAKAENMVMLGCYIAKKSLLTIDDALQAFQAKVGKGKPKILEMNRKALEAGFNWVKEHCGPAV